MASLDTVLELDGKVKIKTYKRRPDYWVARMDKYMGSEVTIKDIQFKQHKNEKGAVIRSPVIKIEEDQKDVPNGWDWSPYNFENI